MTTVKRRMVRNPVEKLNNKKILRDGKEVVKSLISRGGKQVKGFWSFLKFT